MTVQEKAPLFRACTGIQNAGDAKKRQDWLKNKLGGYQFGKSKKKWCTFLVLRDNIWYIHRFSVGGQGK